MWIKQSTAVVVSFGPFLDKTDGVTLEVGLVSAIDHATTGILLSKNGGALTIRSQAVTASTYDAHGDYRVTLSTTDTNTLGTLRVMYTDAATCLPVWHDFMVVPAAMWNSLFNTSGGNLPNAAADAAGGLPISDAGGLDLDAKLANTNEVTAARMGALTDWINGGRLDLIIDDILLDTGTTLDGRLPAALVSGRIDASVGAMAANVLTAAATATDFGTELATAIWTDTTAGDFTVALSVGKSVMNGVTLGTGLTVARCTLTDTLTTYTGNTVQTGDSFARIGVAGAGLTNIDLPNQTMDITGNLSGSVGSVTGAVGSVTGAVGSVTGNVGGNVVGSVASVTATVSADMISISGDSVAADNMEKEYDGTGYGHILQRTTIATLASQTSFTLTAGSADNDAYNGCILVIEDVSTAAQKAVAVIDDYTGSTKTITLRTDPAVFTMAATDIVTIIADKSLKPTVDFRTLDISTGGEAGVDWANVGSPTTAVGLSGTTVKTATDVETDTADIQSRLPAALVSGRIDASVGAMASGVLTATAIAADAITAAKIADGAIDAATFAAGAIDAAAMNVTGSEFTAIPWNAAWDAEVQSEVEDAIVAHRLDELLNADSDIDGAAPPTVGSVFHELMTKTTGSFTFDQTTDSIEAIRDNMGTAQTGDVYAIANSGTHGNAALKTLIDTVDDLLDTEVAAIKAKTDNLPASPAAVGSAMALTSSERDSVAAALLDLAAGIETGMTLRQAMRLFAAALLGKSSNGGKTFRDTNDTKARITGTVDASNNRTAVTLDAT